MSREWILIAVWSAAALVCIGRMLFATLNPVALAVVHTIFGSVATLLGIPLSVIIRRALGLEKRQ
jgi:hypothetical protein